MIDYPLEFWDNERRSECLQHVAAPNHSLIIGGSRMADKPIPTPDELRQLLSYDSGTGFLRWKHRDIKFFRDTENRTASHAQAIWNATHPGKIATWDGSKGYLQCGVLKRKFMAHTVAWAIHYGEWPDKDIDHINGSRSDNRISNLRLATRKQNSANRGPNPGRLVKGVYKHRNNRWRVQFCIGGKSKYIGIYDTIKEAADAYDELAKLHYGEFARLNNYSAGTQDRLSHLL